MEGMDKFAKIVERQEEIMEELADALHKTYEQLPDFMFEPRKQAEKVLESYTEYKEKGV